MGLFEIIIILAVALIVLGPERMPDVVRMAVQIIREVRTAANEAMREITEAIEQESPANQVQPEYPPTPADSSEAMQEITEAIDRPNPSTSLQSEPPGSADLQPADVEPAGLQPGTPPGKDPV